MPSYSLPEVGSLAEATGGGPKRKEILDLLMRLLIAFLLLFVSVAPALAEGWASTLSSHNYGPTRIVAVDKESQTLIMLERRSPLHEVRRFPCTTGQALGDKEVEGDLRTPEGVYFIGQKIDRPLDWSLYGNLAYSLNYPNPIDRIKGKTGGGIWLHGRGKTFVPRDTRGCIALKEPDMRDVEQAIAYGMPVVVAEDIKWTTEPGENASVVETLVGELRKWARNWESRSETFFDSYDPARMALSEGRSFERFIDHKKNIFAATPWIHVMVDNIRAVPGPDYWVTWFDQYYRTPNMASTTGKRFYWMKGADGVWHIVGREYIQASEDLTSKYLAQKSAEVEQFIGTWKRAWLSMDAKMYSSLYTPHAVMGTRKGVPAIMDYKRALWEKAAPAKIDIADLKVSSYPEGLQVAFMQTFENAKGYIDVGRKTMVLVPDGATWKINSEQWRRER